MHGRRLVIRAGTLMVAVSTLAMAFIGISGRWPWSPPDWSRALARRHDHGLLDLHRRSGPGRESGTGDRLVRHLGLLPIGIAPALGDLILTTDGATRGFSSWPRLFARGRLRLSLFLQRSGVACWSHDHRVSGGADGVRALRPVWIATVFLSIAFTTAFIFVKTYVTTTGLNSVGPFFAAFALSAVGVASGVWKDSRQGGSQENVGPGLALYADRDSRSSSVVGGTAGLAHRRPRRPGLVTASPFR